MAVTVPLIGPHPDASSDFRPAPIPASDILEGAPVARSLPVAELGEGLSVWMWDCTAGRFTWAYGAYDEVVHIVEGAVTVTDQDGKVVHLVAGDVAAFRAGTTAHWEVPEYVKKVAVTRGLPGDPLSRAVRFLRALVKRLLGR